MALFEREIKDGIQLAHDLDYCYKCYKAGQVIRPEDNIAYQEVFKFRINGLEHCICLKHFNEMLGDYVLIHKDVMNNKREEILEIPYDVIDNGTEADVLDYINKAIKNNER